MPCFVWWWLEPAWWPGKNDGSELAGSAQYTIAIAIKTIPATMARMARRRRFGIAGSLGGSRVRGVGELAELGRQQICGLLADVNRTVADALNCPRYHDHP
jgi:hypothetical protein